MDAATIATDYILLQKRSFNNLFDTITLFQDCAENTSNYWAYRMGLNKSVHSAIDQWRATMKQSRSESKKLIDDSLSSMENYLAGFKKPI